MYVRGNLVSVDPGRIDELIGYVEQQVLPVIREDDGSRGLAVGVDRETGRCSVVTFWADLDALRASEPGAGGLRAEAGERLGATFDVTVAEVVERHVRDEPRLGCWNRVTMLDLAPADIDAAVHAFRSSTLPALDALDGFCAAMLCADRERGRAVAVTTWRDRDAMRASTDRANTLREEIRDKAHGDVAAVLEEEIVLTAEMP